MNKSNTKISYGRNLSSVAFSVYGQPTVPRFQTKFSDEQVLTAVKKHLLKVMMERNKSNVRYFPVNNSYIGVVV